MKIYGLLGEKLSHSFSPQIHSKLADYPYIIFEKQQDDVESFLKSDSFDGINVTIPYKKTVMPYCTELSPDARRIGSVNTIIKRSGCLFGDNTDYYGFLYMLKKSGINVQGKKALVLGSGGTSLTVCAVLNDIGAGEVVVISRRGENNYQNLHRNYDADVIINTTPVGMYPNNGISPIELRQFKRCAGVLDIIYNPSKTKLLLDAENLGIPNQNGLIMLVAQAKRACELFQDCTIDDGVIDKITEEIEMLSKNIALIGMPGCGKNTIGQKLAEITGREFVDTDAMVVEAAGKSIKKIFEEDGEPTFRKLETEMLSNAAKRSGLIISTGGGLVTQAHNRELIQQNSTIVFINRPLDELPTDGRPLSETIGVEKLSEERIPIYRKWKDYEFECTEETAENIKAKLGI